VIQVLSALGTHSLALVVYPGLLTLMVSGGLMELLWIRLSTGRVARASLRPRRPTPVVVTVALCSMLAAVQLAAPFNPVPTEERNVVIAAVALAFTSWAEVALAADGAEEPGLVLAVQFCWLLAVLGPAVQPESLRPQVLGNVLVPGLLPLKVACGFLYLLCLPVLLRLWPIAFNAGERTGHGPDLARGLCWFSYSGLFTTLFFTPPTPDAPGLLRFFAITFLVAGLTAGAALVLDRRGRSTARGLYLRAVPFYAGLVLLLVALTALLMR